MLCEQCRQAEATLNLSYKLACSSREKALCDPCARALDLPYPFTLRPLRMKDPSPETGPPPQ